MKKRVHSLICLAVLCANIGRGDEVPFFSSLRAEIVRQITIVTNTLPLNKKLLTGLTSNLKTLDRTKPTFVTGSTALGTLATSLSRTALSNTFLPILTDTRTVYIDAMDTEKRALKNRLATTFPGKARATAQTAIDKLSAALDDSNTNNNFSTSIKSLGKAAKAFETAAKAVVKAEIAKPGADFLTATVIESIQGTNLFKATKKTILDATYDPSTGEINIDTGHGKKLGGGRAQVWLLSIAAFVPGEGTYRFSLTNANNSYAIYEGGIVTDIYAPDLVLETEEHYLTVNPTNATLGTGTLTITLDLEANIVWGEFRFTAAGTMNPNLQASVTGSFLIRLETPDGTFP